MRIFVKSGFASAEVNSKASASLFSLNISRKYNTPLGPDVVAKCLDAGALDPTCWGALNPPPLRIETREAANGTLKDTPDALAAGLGTRTETRRELDFMMFVVVIGDGE